MSAVLTVLFVVTGGWATLRLAQVATRRGPAADVVAELTHLVMSVAMVAMTWGVVAGPADPGGAATLLVFGLVAAWALAGLARPASRLRSVVTGHHLLMAAAMIWMVATMPRIMGVSDAAAPAAMPSMAGMPALAAVPEPPVWVIAPTCLLVLVLGAAAALWAVRGLRSPSSASSPAAPEAPTARGAGGCGGVAVLAAPSAPALVPTRRVGRLDACCHALMSAGMAAMIVAML